MSTKRRRSRGHDRPADPARLDVGLRCDACREPALPDPTRRDDLGLPELWITHRAACPVAKGGSPQ